MISSVFLYILFRMWWWSQLIWQSVRADHNSYRIFYRFFPGDAPYISWSWGEKRVERRSVELFFGSIESPLIHWGEVLCWRFKDGRHGRIGWCFCWKRAQWQRPMPRTNTMARCGRGTWNHCKIMYLSPYFSLVNYCNLPIDISCTVGKL